MRFRLNFAMLVALSTFLVGVSFLTEDYSSPASTHPFALLDWLPGMGGQQWWGVLYLVGGVMLGMVGAGQAVDELWLPWWMEVAVCVVGAGIWGLFGATSLYVSVFSPVSDRWGSGWAVFSLAMVLCLVAAGTDSVADR